MEKDNLKTLLDYLLFLQPQIGKLINIEDITMHQTELAELERLAEIGHATEKAYSNGACMTYYDKEAYQYVSYESINELIERI